MITDNGISRLLVKRRRRRRRSLALFPASASLFRWRRYAGVATLIRNGDFLQILMCLVLMKLQANGIIIRQQLLGTFGTEISENFFIRKFKL